MGDLSDTEPVGGATPSFYRRRVAPAAATVAALAAKSKLLLTAGSMAVSVAAYASLWGVWFAVGFVALLYVHETGHVIALRREGIRASAPVFIPFLGAVIGARSLGADAGAEARVGLAGPLLGSAGAGVCLVIWRVSGNPFWQALAYTGLLLNLFNLLPVVPLDGGRAMAAMTPWMWVAGLAAMIAVAVIAPNPLIIIISVLAAFETVTRLQARRRNADANAGYYQVPPRTRILVAVTYLGLICALVLGMHATHLAAHL